MSIQFFIVLIYVILLFGVSFYMKRRADKNPAEYLFAGRQFGPCLVAFAITGMAVGAASTVGVAESATKLGLSAGWYNGAWAIGAIIMGLVAAGKYRSLECTTVPELFERSYDKKARIISVIGLSIIMICITSLQYVAGGSILSSLMPDVFTMRSGMIASAVVFIGITAIGGLWSSGVSNLVSVTIIYIGLIYSVVRVLTRDGGLAGIAAKLPVVPGLDWTSPFGGLTAAMMIGWIIVMTTQAITAQGPVQIACGARDVQSARKGFILGGFLIFPIGFLSAILGMAALAEFPNINPTKALPQIVMSLDPVASGLTLAALWAADVSTACTILLGAGTLVSQDIYKRFINPNISESDYVKANRIIILIIGVITLWMAFNMVGIVKMMMIGLSLTTAFTLVFLCTMFAPGLCRKNTAFWTTLVGILGLVAWTFIPSIRIFPHVIYFEWLICIITLLIVRLIDKEPIKQPTLKKAM
ncbi:MAG: sodium:solute symporter family protein [Acidaminococcus sp.]|jgi:SSS family solute:Na+ symporter|nr:sodium:solute symporter family protein [Acidaminococcus sp.]MCI2099730.1 sodium:solute symporter family protein [Acidaminococcus sp.]MCI2114000.1 sodium:solute symporter family protein [Acidaminococcus sp.]MCI2116109.1 sodium:solute symporter family protein [Acidaminococcus sp.]